jgi:hypothetical protein
MANQRTMPTHHPRIPGASRTASSADVRRPGGMRGW